MAGDVTAAADQQVWGRKRRQEEERRKFESVKGEGGRSRRGSRVMMMRGSEGEEGLQAPER